jgi:hypothetical protein
VLDEDNAETYWRRSDSFDMALDLTAGRRGLAALGEAVERWLAHLLALEVKLEPLIAAENVDLAWYVGLDAQATAIGDTLWNGEDLDEAARERIVGLYRMVVAKDAALLDKVKSDAMFLILAMTPERVLRMKPQNLITGLPLAQLRAAS